MKVKPVIGITANFVDDDKMFKEHGLGAKGQDWSVIVNDYSKAVVEAGGIPMIIPVETNREYLMEVGDLIDGLILSGGEDVDPLIYGGIPDDKTGRISPKRDEAELFLLDYFYNKTDKPILAVCRGLQVLNIYLNGTLILDIPRAGYNIHSISVNYRYNPVHLVNIKKDSLLYEIIGSVKTGVNSLHHQGIDELGEGLRIVARAEDQLVEAVEGENIRERFVLGLQWHPEMVSIKDVAHKRIFKYFINEAIKKKK